MRKGLLFHLAIKTNVFEPVKRTYLYLEHSIWVDMPQIKLLPHVDSREEDYFVLGRESESHKRLLESWINTQFN